MNATLTSWLSNRSARVNPPGPRTTTAAGRIAERTAMANEVGANYMEAAEIKRIVGLPAIRPMDTAELEEFNRTHVLALPFLNGFRLFPIQAEALAAYETYGGLFAPIGVGWGKTAVTLLCAEHAYKSRGIERILLLVPSNVLSQLADVDIAWVRARMPLSVPIHILGGKVANYRRALSASGRRGLYIMPYSLLSTKDTSENLNAIRPGLIIADEAHNLANAEAARTRRLMKALEDFSPEFIALSGTITSKTIKNYWHLIKAALKDRCPLPLSAHMTNDWAALIDAQASSPDAPAPTSNTSSPILPLVVWAKEHFPRARGGFPQDVFGFRRAYQARLTSCPGVVSSGDAEIGTSLVLSNNPVADHETHPDWPKLKNLVDTVEELWQTPNGDELEHAIHKWKWLNELSAGFYNELIWPTAEKLAERRRITVPAAENLLDRARVHHAAGQEYAKALRSWLLASSKPGIDTPFLVGQDMMRHQSAHVGQKLYSLWSDWKDLDFEGRPERDSRAVRVCGYKVEAAGRWAQKLHADNPHAGAILWVHHQELGEWLYEHLMALGLPALHCPAGENANAAIRDPANASRFVVASISAHGTGKNLQHFQEQFFLQWPRDARAAEQALGRTHRNGQKADELVVNTCHTLTFDAMNFAACLNDALYIHQTTGNRQKLIYAIYDPLPKIFPPAVLFQRGLEAIALDNEQQAMLHEKFGAYASAA